MNRARFLRLAAMASVSPYVLRLWQEDCRQVPKSSARRIERAYAFVRADDARRGRDMMPPPKYVGAVKVAA